MSTRPLYTDRGIVLHTTKYGERKLIVHMLTAAHGRCSYITSANKSTSRALFQPLSLLEVTASTPVGEGLHAIKEVALSPALHSIGSSPAKAMIVMMVSELLYRTVRDGDESIHAFAHSAIVDFDKETNSTAIANFHLHFMVQLASLMGFAPQGNYVDGAYFDIKEGQYTLTEPQHTLYFRTEIAGLLFVMQNTRHDELQEVALNSSIRREFLNSMVDYIGYHNEAVYSVRSISMLSEVF